VCASSLVGLHQFSHSHTFDCDFVCVRVCRPSTAPNDNASKTRAVDQCTCCSTRCKPTQHKSKHHRDTQVRETYREPMLLFHRKFASCFKDTPTAPHYWKHAFESCYIFPGAAPPSPTAALATSASTAAFALWARDTNPSLQHWKSR
jgi:hypothetical protein